MEKRISGHTGLLALIGSPVGHSGSPAMYNYSFEKLGLDYAYVAFDIKEDKVKDAIAAMKTFNMRGCNVTMPDKVEAAKYMDELSPAARIIGAINTIVNDNGKLTGYITDGEGFVHNLKDHGIDIKGKELLQLSRCSAHWTELVRLLFSTKMMLSSSVHYRLQRRSKKQFLNVL